MALRYTQRIMGLLLCWVVLSTSQSMAGVYWLDPLQGNNANPGTESQPWKTLLGGVIKRSPPLVGGHTINIKSGSYTRTQLMGTGSAGTETYWRGTDSRGTAKHPLILQAEPGGTVTIDAQRIESMIRIEDPTGADYYLIIRNLNFVNLRGNVIALGHARFLTLDNNSFQPIYDGTSSAFVGGYTQYVILRNNRITDSGRIAPGMTYNDPATNGIYYGDDVRDWLVEGNVITKSSESGLNLWGESGSNCPASWPFRGITYRRNIIHNATKAGLLFGGTCPPPKGAECTDCYIYHNTIYTTKTPFPEAPKNGQPPENGVDLRATQVHNWNFVNNILVGPFSQYAFRYRDDPKVAPFSIGQQDHNLLRNEATSSRTVRYRGTAYTLDAWRTKAKADYGKALDANSITSDPAFVNRASGDFALTASSPARDAGKPLTTATTSGKKSTTLTVQDAKFFNDGWDMVQGDTIQIAAATPTSTAVITKISGNTITLAEARSWEASAGVSLPWQGRAPDMGALEFAEADTPPPPPPPPDPILLNPVEGLTATATETDIRLTWTYSPHPERPGTGFQLARCAQTPDGCVMAPYDTLGVAGRTYTNKNNLAIGTTYCYTLQPRDGQDPAGPVTAPVCATFPPLPPPLTLTVTALSCGIPCLRIAWEIPPPASLVELQRQQGDTWHILGYLAQSPYVDVEVSPDGLTCYRAHLTGLYTEMRVEKDEWSTPVCATPE